MNFTRREAIKNLGLGVALTTLPTYLQANQSTMKPKPNILFILVDDLGYGDLSGYGATDLKTPHIDRLCASGMRFDHFYANCPVCSPTRASLMTGRYPDLVGVPGVIRTYPTDNFGYLNEKAIMLPTLLKNAGYHTAIVGKWHLGLESLNTPNERGFDFFHGFLGDMMDDYYHHRRHDRNYMRLNHQEIDPSGHATDLFTQWAIDYIQNQGSKKQPFFLYLAYNAPHTPIQPPEAWLESVKKRQPGIDEKRANLVALIEHLDHGIGQVIQALNTAGLAENTLIVFTSDNGGQLNVGANNGTLRGGKQMMWEGGIRVSMCAVWPGKINAGTRSEQVALTMDWFATLCEIADVPVQHEIDGRSILPTLLGQAPASAERMLFWVRREGGHYGGNAYYAVRSGDWKLVQNTPFEPYQLFNLKADPQEQQPVDSSHPMYQQLFKALRQHIIEAGAVPWQKYPVKF